MPNKQIWLYVWVQSPYIWSIDAAASADKLKAGLFQCRNVLLLPLHIRI